MSDEIRKPWKQEGVGCAKEGPQVPVGLMQFKIHDFEPIDLESEEFKRTIAIREAVRLSRPEEVAQWFEISLVSEEAKARKIKNAIHADIRLQNIVMYPEPPASPKIEVVPVAPKIEVVPGYGFGRLLGSFLPKKLREHVLEPLLADAMQDYYDACEARDETRVKRIRYMVYIWMLGAVFRGTFFTILGVLKASKGISKD
jgi:hypothetical protein